MVESLGGSGLAMLAIKGLRTNSDLYMAYIPPLMQEHKAFSLILSFARKSEQVERCESNTKFISLIPQENTERLM